MDVGLDIETPFNAIDVDKAAQIAATKSLSSYLRHPLADDCVIGHSGINIGDMDGDGAGGANDYNCHIALGMNVGIEIGVEVGGSKMYEKPCQDSSFTFVDLHSASLQDPLQHQHYNYAHDQNFYGYANNHTYTQPYNYPHTPYAYDYTHYDTFYDRSTPSDEYITAMSSNGFVNPQLDVKPLTAGCIPVVTFDPVGDEPSTHLVVSPGPPNSYSARGESSKPLVSFAPPGDPYACPDGKSLGDNGAIVEKEKTTTPATARDIESYTTKMVPSNARRKRNLSRHSASMSSLRSGDLSSFRQVLPYEPRRSRCDLDIDDTILTPVTLRPRRTHIGCSTIKYNRITVNEDIGRTYFCDFEGNDICSGGVEYARMGTVPDTRGLS